MLDTSLPITVTATTTMSDPVRVSGGGVDDVLADHEDDVWCRTQSRVVDGRRAGSRIFTVFSDTWFCYDGNQLASHNPRFSAGIMFLNIAWSVAHYDDHEEGVVGDWEHWDFVTWSFQRCVNGTCGDSIHPWIKKWQRGDGSGRIRYFRG